MLNYTINPNRGRGCSTTAFESLLPTVLTLILAFGMLSTTTTAVAEGNEDNIGEALAGGKFSLDTRLRYEKVNHDAFANNASAMTFRSRFGYTSAGFKGFTAFIEGDFTRDLEPNNFNSTVNGKGVYPVVADPDSARLNRLTLSYSGLENTAITMGRQRIKLDNDRFIGNVGFRQNEQTFDAVRIANTSIKNLKFDYTYLWQVNRIFGSKSAVAKWDADTHLLNASFSFANFGKLTGYAYLIDLFNAPGLSNRTYGTRFSGTHKASDTLSFTYAAEFASQSDYARNPADFSLTYFLVQGGVKYRGFTGRVAYEQLEGNGERGFVTPLATLHAFQGFTDNFLATPSSGITDLQFYGDYVFKDVGTIGKVKVAGWYHDFGADVGSEDLGEEFDFLIALNPWKRWSLAFKYARFSGADLRPDVSKLWLALGFKY